MCRLPLSFSEDYHQRRVKCMPFTIINCAYSTMKHKVQYVHFQNVITTFKLILSPSIKREVSYNNPFRSRVIGHMGYLLTTM